MSYPMSPPSQKPPPPQQQQYPPYQNAASAPAPSQFGPPPAKRQRMSPDPRPSPNGTPTYAHMQHGAPGPNNYGNPYAPSSARSPFAPSPTGYATSPQGSFNTPQAYPFQHAPWQSQPGTPASAGPQLGSRQNSPPQHLSREMMPPPPRPNKEEREERVGYEDLGDSLYGSGINLKDEENYHYTQSYNHPHQADSFSTNQDTSFGSSTLSPNNSFNLLTQGTSFRSQDTNGAFSGTLRQARSENQVELEQRRKREAAAAALAERRQHHLNNQFLLCNNVRKRMDRLALNQGVTLNMVGVFVREPDTHAQVNGDRKEGIVANSDKVTDVRPESVVNQNTPFEPLVSLVSLAAGERLRGLLDDAYALVRARQYGDHGRVIPTDFADIAEGEGKRQDESVGAEQVTSSPWDKPATSDSATPQPQRTVSFQGTLNAHLRSLAERDRAAEQARVKKREARRRAAEAAANGEALTSATDGLTEAALASGPTDPSASTSKITKKEAAKQAKEKNTSTEAQLHITTNQTAAMMTLGKKGRKYDWMTGGAAAMPTNRFAKPGASGTATPTKAAGETSAGSTTPGAVPMAKTGSGTEEDAGMREWGKWNEASANGIEMRDWLLVLERDGKEKAALEKAMCALK